MLLIGIDEAGYGPVLGPLCHGLCVFRVPEADEAPDLWKVLAPAVARAPLPSGSAAFCVDDSKKVYAGARKLERLAHAVQGFRGCVQDAPAPCDGALLDGLLDNDDRARLEADAWGRAANETVFDAPDARAATALAERMAAQGVALLRYRAAALSAGDYNLRVDACGSKAEVNWARAGVLLREGVACAAPGEAVHTVIDRLGGRKFYGPALSARFDGAFVRIETEAKGHSAYRMDLDGRAVRVAFREKADAGALPVALASMAAKLARELSMARFNAFFCGHDADLAPTAGYYTDAQRFLKDSAALRKKLKVPDTALIRVK